jgi:hypothetical protein
MPAYNGRITIVDVAESDYGRVPHMTEMQLHAQALQRALVDRGLLKEAHLNHAVATIRAGRIAFIASYNDFRQMRVILC